jgi:hypothetical protein
LKDLWQQNWKPVFPNAQPPIEIFRRKIEQFQQDPLPEGFLPQIEGVDVLSEDTGKEEIPEWIIHGHHVITAPEDTHE